ncbi:hypothetical protein G6F59_018009 [Rhizopus arrhizus]|nr:hypothetical protein G6F59_018009 [Rhizopus arrhizus]
MGPSGSFQKFSGRMAYFSGFSRWVRAAASWDLSPVNASQRPTAKARMILSRRSTTTGLNTMFCERNQSDRFNSVVVPGCTHTVAPSNSLALFTFRDLFTMMPWLS